MSDRATVTVEVLAVEPPTGRLRFATVALEVAGLVLVLHGVRIVTDRDGARRVLPPLHAAGKGRLAEGWALPPEVAAAVAELVLETSP